MLSLSTNYTVEDFGTGLRLELRYRKQWLELARNIFVLVVLLTFLVTFPFGPFMLFEEGGLFDPFPFSIVRIVNTVILLVIALSISVETLWQLIGREIIEITAGQIVIRHQIFGIGFNRKFKADQIDAVFVSRHKDNWATSLFTLRESRFLLFRRGRVAVNSGKTLFGEVRTFRFGSILEEAEAKQIVEAIHLRFPQYKYKARQNRSGSSLNH